ncbi:glutaredoxin [Rheinheimera phage vB_RspM_Barba22A]|jgi:glutaredoxin|uniref:Thioredoxin domain-containing protein n=81 Tax=Barbavirus TaxID=2733095 RepID=A0A7G9VS30_9CAUD|nr:thioredoxin domain [Rheinheimera phage vB_RspM_Barba18A]YP_009823161.1 thioredoxin domain [Rheinheimera phage Barba21A]QCQ57856.1 glutaredoxin [Rheinheimera phage vB_RspM_Barba1A]QCQ57992.1 glutaredoxin [Rheinheimera phage vB_RspM_Barba1S]QCQ58128.1 glutaredoxin [Rheinheimera phage vB_RspM_Barba2A]QCQ58264.1 glutaredoxin [Rheinheimera phage vB_RspM_Barba2S]QCQ58399.1 glutaredoxin [Rheinheimera phage vB_RspM_Barba3A]QCQ58538.1 glutaredoxin [Rheinheimera phage vB_RspM_Barba3S]QCQ58674.1 gl
MFDKVVLAGAPWCSSCKGMKDVLNSMGVEYEYIDIDTDNGAVFAQQNRIRSLPTTLFTLGNKTEVVIGSKNVQFLKEFIATFKE